MEDIRLGVVGAGKMGGALLRGWVQGEVLNPASIRLYNRRLESAQAIADELGAEAVEAAAQAVSSADIVLIAVKPHFVAGVLAEIAPALPPECLVLSIAAGITLGALEAALAGGSPVIRVMSNIPALLGEGASAYCRGTHATADHAALVARLFAAVGRVVEVAVEDQIDAVTGVAGSGVAFFYLLIEALIDGGVRAGLPRDSARILATQSALGAARMILETGEHPAALKDAVTTPGGTTMAGLEILENAAVRGALIGAVVAARDRARELR